MPTPNFQLPYLFVNQANKEITHNRALVMIDAALQLRVLDKDLSTPPASPVDGDAYIAASGATGLWSGHATEIAVWVAESGVWMFAVPKTGYRAYVVDEGLFYQFNGFAWIGGVSSNASATDTVTASTTQTQVGATAINTQVARLTTVANTGDSVRINYAATPGASVEIRNDGANAAWIWPFTGGIIDGGAANARDANALAAGSTRRYRSFTAGTWRTV